MHIYGGARTLILIVLALTLFRIYGYLTLLTELSYRRAVGHIKNNLKMKKTFFFGMFICLIISCGKSSSTLTQQPSKTPITTNPFGQTYEVPDFEPDTEDYFAATGIATGAKERMGVLRQDALTNAQNIIRQKMEHAYEGMISDYSKSIGINTATDIKTKIERGGDQIIEAIVKDTQERSVKYSGVDEKGNVTCFVSIRISKKQVADKIADQISEDQDLKLRFDEEQFRKRMQEKFKEYKEKQK